MESDSGTSIDCHLTIADFDSAYICCQRRFQVWLMIETTAQMLFRDACAAITRPRHVKEEIDFLFYFYFIFFYFFLSS